MNKQQKKILFLAGTFTLLAFAIFMFAMDLSATFSAILGNHQHRFSDNKGLHWGHMPITYSIEASEIGCSDSQLSRIRQAVSIIQQETGNAVIFEEVEEEGDIKIYFNGVKANTSSFLEGSYKSKGDLIISGTLDFYLYPDYGTWPDVEIQGFLIMMGYRIVNDEESIMSSTFKEDDLGKIDEWIVRDLIEAYKK